MDKVSEVSGVAMLANNGQLAIWGADLAYVQLICTFNKGCRCLLCVIDIFSKYAWVAPLKDKRGGLWISKNIG